MTTILIFEHYEDVKSIMESLWEMQVFDWYVSKNS